MRLLVHILLLVFLPGMPLAGASTPVQPLVLLSIDGLKPTYLEQADALGLRIPNLRALCAKGSYSMQVRGVLPTITYPAHTTLITGASPAHHGILANGSFDPMERNQHGWSWYAQDIQVPTLWDAAHAAGLRTANVHWPVSVGAEIDWNLPQIWRSGMPDDRKLVRALSTKGLVDGLEAQLGPYADGQNDTLDGDEIRARFAVRLLQTRRPAFMTVYLTALDTQQHRTGPFSPEANAVLERLDAWVGALHAAMKGRGILCIVSDHGFRAVDQGFELRKAFGDLGLFKKGDKSWELAIWNCGGSFAVMLRDPSNHELHACVKARLEDLKRDPAVDRVIERDELARRRGFSGAPFVVVLKAGWYAKGDPEPFAEDLPPKGAHGYLPEDPEMASIFLIAGAGIPKGRNVGPIDMRQIAPTLARCLNLRLKGAELPALSFAPFKP